MTRDLEIHATKMRLKNAIENLRHINRRRHEADRAAGRLELWARVKRDIEFLRRAQRQAPDALDQEMQQTFEAVRQEMLFDV